MMRKIAFACLSSAALIVASAGAASAGETTGNGKPVPAPTHAASICSFSGQNDSPDAEGLEGGRTQSYGQVVRQGGKGFVPNPGAACNPNAGFVE